MLPSQASTTNSEEISRMLTATTPLLALGTGLGIVGLIILVIIIVLVLRFVL